MPAGTSPDSGGSAAGEKPLQEVPTCLRRGFRKPQPPAARASIGIPRSRTSRSRDARDPRGLLLASSVHLLLAGRLWPRAKGRLLERVAKGSKQRPKGRPIAIHAWPLAPRCSHADRASRGRSGVRYRTQAATRARSASATSAARRQVSALTSTADALLADRASSDGGLRGGFRPRDVERATRCTRRTAGCGAGGRASLRALDRAASPIEPRC